MVNNKLEEGIAALNLGNSEKGRRLLNDIIKANYASERIWMHLALRLEDPQMKRDCFERVLQINPNNVKANKELMRLEIFS